MHTSTKRMICPVSTLCAIIIILTALISGVKAGIIAKSEVEKCVADGGVDPMTAGTTTCENKIVVSVTVAGGQGPTNAIEVIVNEAVVSGENRTLVAPIRITYQKSQPLLLYALDYVQNVNNKPYELIIEKASIAGGVFDRCIDDGSTDSTCGVFIDRENNNVQVPESQGFCCSCDTFGQNGDIFRSDIDCGNIFSNQASAHCLRFDDLAYSLYSLSPPQQYFQITVNVEKYNNDTGEYEKTDDIRIGPQRVGDRSLDGSLTAVFEGEFAPATAFRQLSDKYLSIPSPPNVVNEQNVNGANDWMLVDKFLVGLDGSVCNTVGVSHNAFRNQGERCGRAKGDCLNNQLKDFWEADTLKRQNNLVGDYFVGNFGNFGGIFELVDAGTDQGSLRYAAYYSDQLVNSLMTISVSADDIRFVTNESPGVIVSANIPNFEAISRDGRLTVTIQNTGTLLSDYNVVVLCTSGILPISQQLRTVASNALSDLQFQISSVIDESVAHECTVELVSSQFKLLDSRVVGFSTEKTEETDGTQGGEAPSTSPSDESFFGDGSFFDSFLRIGAIVLGSVAALAALLGGIVLFAPCVPCLVPVAGVITSLFFSLCCCCCGKRRKNRRAAEKEYNKSKETATDDKAKAKEQDNKDKKNRKQNRQDNQQSDSSGSDSSDEDKSSPKKPSRSKKGKKRPERLSKPIDGSNSRSTLGASSTPPISPQSTHARVYTNAYTSHSTPMHAHIQTYTTPSDRLSVLMDADMYSRGGLSHHTAPMYHSPVSTRSPSRISKMTSSQILSTDTSHYSPKPLSSPMTSPVPPRPTNRPMRQLTQTPQFGPALTSSESISRTDSSNSLLGSSSNPVGSPNKIVGSSSNLASMNSPSQESIFSANAESIYSPTGVTNTGSITSPSTEQLISAHAPVTTPPSEPIKTPETNDTVLHPKRQSFSTVDLEDDEMSLR